MSEPEKKHCPHCGSQMLRWNDIVACMREFIPSAPIGLKPMLIQAAEELERDRVDAKRYRRLRENWVDISELALHGRLSVIDAGIDMYMERGR